jgi:hypothetical protein
MIAGVRLELRSETAIALEVKLYEPLFFFSIAPTVRTYTDRTFENKIIHSISIQFAEQED